MHQIHFFDIPRENFTGKEKNVTIGACRSKRKQMNKLNRTYLTTCINNIFKLSQCSAFTSTPYIKMASMMKMRRPSPITCAPLDSSSGKRMISGFGGAIACGDRWSATGVTVEKPHAHLIFTGKQYPVRRRRIYIRICQFAVENCDDFSFYF